MNNSINIMKLLFYGYLGLILYLYVKEASELNFRVPLTDKQIHFIVFFILGSIAQVINENYNWKNRSQEWIEFLKKFQ